MVEDRVHFPEGFLEGFCKRNHIRKLSLFGSVLGSDFRPDSDIDILVEFEPGKTPGYKIVAIESELAKQLGRKVDLRTPQEISRYSRERILNEAYPAYVG